jgi:iron complex transport system substrate-binding protein
MLRSRIDLIFLALALAGCSRAPQSELTADIVKFDPGPDYFPAKCTVRYAQQFTVEYHRNYKLVNFHSIATGESKQYILVQRGTPAPPPRPGATQIDIPLRRFAITSYRYGAAIETFGLDDRLFGVGNSRAVTTPKIRQRIDRGVAKELNPDSGLNLEQAVSARLDAVFTYYSSTTIGNIHGKLAEARLAAIPLADDQERSPLARSEWVKLFALFFNREAEAEKWFDAAAASYASLVARGAQANQRPTVLVNYAQRDVWNVYGGRNAFAKLVADAGGDYLWRDDSSFGLVPLTFEEVSHRALAADVWIVGPGFGRVGLDSVLQQDARIVRFPARRNGRIYACAALTADGRNPYWDQALMAPDAELADMVHMLHPDLNREHEFRFYRKVNLESHASN